MLGRSVFPRIGELTYLQWLQRYVELAIGDGDSTADTAAPGSPWLADTWRDRFHQMLQRTEARLDPLDSGPIETLFDDAALLETAASLGGHSKAASRALENRPRSVGTLK